MSLSEQLNNILLLAEFSAMDYIVNIVSKCRFSGKVLDFFCQ